MVVRHDVGGATNGNGWAGQASAPYFTAQAQSGGWTLVNNFEVFPGVAAPQAATLAINISRNRLTCFGIFLLLAAPTSALEVRSRLDANSIRYGETVALVLEIDGQLEAGPDLDPLLRDFRIMGRSSSRQMREVNGQREEFHQLRLTLSPLRSGDLEIPPISYGGAVTRPLILEVSTSLPDNPLGPQAGNPSDNGSASHLPPLRRAETVHRPSETRLGMPPKAGYPEYAEPWLTGPGPQKSASQGAEPPAAASLDQEFPPRNVGSQFRKPVTSAPTPSQPHAAEVPPSSLWSRILTGWPWLLSGLVVGVGLIGLGWRWGQRSTIAKLVGKRPSEPAGVISVDNERGAPSATKPLIPITGIRSQGHRKPADHPSEQTNLRLTIKSQDQGPHPTDPIAEAIAEVRRAYESGAAQDARDALLAWAALVLPEQPPGNLALLSRRCREPLRSIILLLDQAHFSSYPVDWKHGRIWELLPAFSPLPPEKPASFRQKKPLRHHSAQTYPRLITK